jgi:hypothetical protein
MPWSKGSQAKGHTHKADTPKKQRQWLHIANAVRKQTGSDARAIREANSVVARKKKKT